MAAAAAEVASSCSRVDLLMNNAGVMAIPLRRTAQDFEAQFATNHLGHFALTARLLPLLLTAGSPRVVTTTSIVHRIGRIDLADPNAHVRYRPWTAYAESKLANLLFTFELDRRARLHRQPLVSVAAHPGYSATHLQAAGPELSGNRTLLQGFGIANRLFAQSAEMGALPQLYAATAPDVVGGAVYGPDRFFESRGYPTRVGVSARAHDEVSARRLWDLSEELTGVAFAWPEVRSAQRGEGAAAPSSGPARPGAATTHRPSRGEPRLSPLTRPVPAARVRLRMPHRRRPPAGRRRPRPPQPSCAGSG